MKKVYIVLLSVILLAGAVCGGYTFYNQSKTPELDASYRGHWKTKSKVSPFEYNYLLIKDNNEVIYAEWEAESYGNLEYSAENPSTVQFLYGTGEGTIYQIDSKIQLSFFDGKIELVNEDDFGNGKKTYILEKYMPNEDSEEYLSDLSVWDKDRTVQTTVEVGSIEKSGDSFYIDDKRINDDGDPYDEFGYHYSAWLRGNENVITPEGTQMKIKDFYKKIKSDKNYFKNNNIKFDVLTDTFSKEK